MCQCEIGIGMHEEALVKKRGPADEQLRLVIVKLTVIIIKFSEARTLAQMNI
jgi:hypothetical protein